MSLDVRALVPADLPSEWAPTPDDVLEAMQLDERGLLTREQVALSESITASRYYLIRNTLAHECTVCKQGALRGAKHTYITRGCIERPFHGLSEVWAYWSEFEQQGGVINEHILTLRLGEVIVPISSKAATSLLLKIHERTGRDLVWLDFRRRYRKRYLDWLRDQGYLVLKQSKEMTEVRSALGQKEVVHWGPIFRTARKEYERTGGLYA